MKKLMVIAITLLAVLMTLPATAGTKSKTVEGMFMGANCMFFNKACPMDMTDAHIAIEPDFVLTKPNGTYFFVINLDRATKAKYIHKNVRVKGALKDQNSINAESLELKKDGKYKTVWTAKAELEERQRMLLMGD